MGKDSGQDSARTRPDTAGLLNPIDFSKLKGKPGEIASDAELGRLKLLALDVDGVLTDGTIIMGPGGEVCKAFYAKDGLGISCALRCGLKLAVITGRRSPSALKRAEELGIPYLLDNVKDKYEALRTLREELGLGQEEVAFMGDDLNDLPAFRAAGLAFAPSDAAAEVMEAADVVTSSRGGRGAVREAVERILRAQGKWEPLVSGYRLSGQGDRQ